MDYIGITTITTLALGGFERETLVFLFSLFSHVLWKGEAPFSFLWALREEKVGARQCNDCAHLACTLPATLACSGRCPSPQQATAVARAGLTAAQRRAVARTAARE